MNGNDLTNALKQAAQFGLGKAAGVRLGAIVE